MITLKQFGDRPYITVRADENKVTLNWPCNGRVSIREARTFLNHFRRAINYAQKQEQKLKRIAETAKVLEDER